jgi:YVTN family beta-propeller protein
MEIIHLEEGFQMTFFVSGYYWRKKPLLLVICLLAILMFISHLRAIADVGMILQTFSYQPNDLVADPSQPYIYASDPGSNCIAVINTESLSVQTIIPIGYPRSLSLSPDGSNLYVADSTNNIIDIISTQTLSIIKSIPLAVSPMDVVP